LIGGIALWQGLILNYTGIDGLLYPTTGIDGKDELYTLEIMILFQYFQKLFFWCLYVLLFSVHIANLAGHKSPITKLLSKIESKKILLKIIATTL